MFNASSLYVELQSFSTFLKFILTDVIGVVDNLGEIIEMQNIHGPIQSLQVNPPIEHK